MGKLKKLVEFEEAMEKFIANYRIPSNVGLRYCEEGEWHFRRQEGEVVIPLIAFIEGGVRFPIGSVMRDYLRHFQLAPTQCTANVFRILGCMDALNEKMELRLTHHDLNWCYNLQHLRGKSYYMKTKDDKVQLIQCLLETSKWLNKDFLIVSGEWHDDLHCPTEEGEPGRVSRVREG